MKKIFEIWVRYYKHPYSYSKEAVIEKFYKLGFKNSFFTKKDDVNYLTDPKNSKKFDFAQYYFIQEVYKKIEEVENTELNPINHA